MRAGCNRFADPDTYPLFAPVATDCGSVLSTDVQQKRMGNSQSFDLASALRIAQI